MSLLSLRMRPIVEFDVNKRQHREDYARFLASGSWGHCPVRYELNESCGELSGAIQRKLLDYYVGREFKIVPKDTRVFKL
jgi:hypothetical protein